MHECAEVHEKYARPYCAPPASGTEDLAREGRQLRILRRHAGEQVLGQLRIGQLEQPLEPAPLPGVGLPEMRRRVTLEQHVEFLQPPPAAPQQPPSLGIERRSHCLQLCRCTSIFLISAMALAGLRSFGHTSVQFMMVWQR